MNIDMKRIVNTIQLSLLILVTSVLSGQVGENEHVVVVAKHGNDAAAGNFSEPFATLERARKAVRALKKETISDTIFVLLREGTYHISESFQLEEKDSGSEFYPVIYSAYNDENVTLNGGVELSADLAKKTTARSVLSRIVPRVRDSIYQVDLRAAGIDDYGKLRPRGFRRPYHPSAMELFCDKEAMTLARWPNKGLEPIGKAIETGSIPRKGDYSNKGGKFEVMTDRLERWSAAEDLWVSGFFYYGYADDALQVSDIDVKNRIISTVQPTMYGFKDGDDHTGWYVFNLLEEIDMPGEYYIDRERGILYFYPVNEEFQTIELSIMEEPMVIMQNSSHVHFRNIRFENSRGMGIYIEGGRSNVVAGCEIRNLGLLGVCVGRGIEPFKKLMHDGTGTPVSAELGSWHEHIYRNPLFNRNAGEMHLIRNCHIYNTGSGGISLSGGDRKTLKKGMNTVENCYIHDFNRLDRTYRAGVNIDGVGNIIRHCEIAHCPASAIYMHGNDHLIEYNEIHHAVMTGDDMGAIYYGRDPSEFGTLVKNNLFHHLGTGDLKAGHRKIVGIYQDDGACGLTVIGNIFYKAGSRAVTIGGGNDNVYRNNIFISGKVAVNHDNRLQRWANYMWKPGGVFEKRLEAVNYKEPPYSTAYPMLVSYFSDTPGLPKRNVIEYNLFWNYDMVYTGKPSFSGFGRNLILCSDPGFQNIKDLDFRLDPDSQVFQLMPDFENIPVQLIGRQNSGL